MSFKTQGDQIPPTSWTTTDTERLFQKLADALPKGHYYPQHPLTFDTNLHQQASVPPVRGTDIGEDDAAGSSDTRGKAPMMKRRQNKRSKASRGQVQNSSRAMPTDAPAEDDWPVEEDLWTKFRDAVEDQSDRGSKVRNEVVQAIIANIRASHDKANEALDLEPSMMTEHARQQAVNSLVESFHQADQLRWSMSESPTWKTHRAGYTNPRCSADCQIARRLAASDDHSECLSSYQRLSAEMYLLLSGRISVEDGQAKDDDTENAGDANAAAATALCAAGGKLKGSLFAWYETELGTAEASRAWESVQAAKVELSVLVENHIDTCKQNGRPLPYVLEGVCDWNSVDWVTKTISREHPYDVHESVTSQIRELYRLARCEDDPAVFRSVYKPRGEEQSAQG